MIPLVVPRCRRVPKLHVVSRGSQPHGSHSHRRRVTNQEQLPGFHDDGEYSERAFEAWLRDAAILPLAPPASSPAADGSSSAPIGGEAENAAAALVSAPACCQRG